MTTPTPDQGALERARELLMPFNGQHLVADDISQDSAWNVLRDEIAELVTAAASEARAAERERCERIVQNYIDRPTSGPKNNTLSAFEQGMDHMAGCIDNASAILDAIRAFATPAQSPSPQTKEPE